MAELDKEFDAYDWQGFTYPKLYARALFDFAHWAQFKNGLEIGFDQGASALALLRGSPKASLLSVDIYPCEAGLEMLRSHEEASRHTFVSADSRVFLLGQIAQQKKYDFIYIDGDHLYDAVRQDLYNAEKLLMPGGYIVADDANPDHGHFGVGKAVAEFCTELGWTHRPLVGSPSEAVIIYKP